MLPLDLEESSLEVTDIESPCESVSAEGVLVSVITEEDRSVVDAIGVMTVSSGTLRDRVLSSAIASVSDSVSD